MNQASETQLDGLSGPTHHYAGLSSGNFASQKNAFTLADPRRAALQGLAKMKLVHDLGIGQLILPPRLLREDWPRALGFDRPSQLPDRLLQAYYSSSSMWAANAASVSPAADTQDGKTHFTPANLVSKLHRSLESPVTARYLKCLFPEPCFIHHDPLPPHACFADEGAANQMRLGVSLEERGLEIFVCGGATRLHAARQTRDASEALIRLHGLSAEASLILEQKSEAIDAGVFHNDVIAMSHADLLIHHEHAFTEPPVLPERYRVRKIVEEELPLALAVSTYFFNSQILDPPKGGMIVIAPAECAENPRSHALFERLKEEGFFQAVHYLDLRESMKNGGGPACLRLRVPLTERETKQVHPAAWFTETRYQSLCRWIETHYRDRLSVEDLRDPSLEEEARKGIDGILSELDMGGMAL
jgi:succinylarginine dihydrolase